MPEPRPADPVIAHFDAFYRDRYRPVVALVYALTGSRWSAEDLAQEAFLRAHRDWNRVGSMASPDGWVRRVAVNLAMSRFRRLRSEAAARLRLTAHTPALQPPTAEADAFWAEVRRLPRRQSQVIALHYLDDLSTAEIAGVLRIAEGTVRALLTQGRERLSSRLQAGGWNET